jgi:hypothetical protein
MLQLRGGSAGKRGRPLPWFYLAALTAAFAAIVLVGIGAPFWHSDAPGTEATCPICHVAHMPVLPGAAATLWATPAAVAWVVPAEMRITHAAPVALDSPPRAPPA